MGARGVFLAAGFALLQGAVPSAFGAEVEPWTREQVVLEVAFAGLAAVDLRQTLELIDRQGQAQAQRRRCLESTESCTFGCEPRELNPVLGKHPTKQAAVAWMVSAVVLHGVVSYILPQRLRTRWQYVTIGWEGSVVWRNWQTGLRFGF